jgi:hypothetical protein
MDWILAFSVQHEVEKYGAYVAVASFLGLALLSILYFAQAREVRRLRDWAGRAPERDAELEARVTSQAEHARRVQPIPSARPAAVSEDTQITPPPVPASNGRGAGAPLTVPMGPRPAAAAAAVAAAVAAIEAAPADAEEAEEVPVPVPAAAAPAAPATDERAEETGEAEATGSGNGNGTGDVTVIPRATPRPAPATAAARPAEAARMADRSATVPPRRTPPPRTGARPGRPAAAPQPAPQSHGRARGILMGVIAGIVVIGVAAVVVTQFGGNATPKPAAPNTTEPPSATSTATGTTSTTGPARADTEVVILNGTTIDGLAAKAKSSLAAHGYTSDKIPTDTGPNQATQQSTVYYAPNRRRQALAVGRVLSISRVAAVDSATQALADNSSDPPVKTDVIVVLGADQTP